MTAQLRAKCAVLYGANEGQRTYDRLIAMMGKTAPTETRLFAFSERDAILICYGDHVRCEGVTSLQALHEFLNETVRPYIPIVHLLPFYPYSSDDGFSVIDYYAVDPALGSWDDIESMHHDFQLMFDAVVNHMSAHSAWFQASLRDESPYDRYFITVDPAADLSLVRRPRALPLLTRFETPAGERHVWTTFSEDQIDLNFANPDVLLEIVSVLLFYVEKGADLIRLDAIAYLWKTIGTMSIHLEQTHLVVQLIRDVLDIVAPHVALITETNVPHDENISYFGDGSNEAQMVYQFPLPPLILHTFSTGSAGALSRWAKTLNLPSNKTSYFNFTASHDGIGVTPLRNLLSDAEIDALCQRVIDHGGFVSYKNNADGTRSPYEMNITYFDAITAPSETAQDPVAGCDRFICSQAMMLALIGVPGIYFHSLFGSRNNLEAVEASGRFRSINRAKPDVDVLRAELALPDSIRRRVYDAYSHLLEVRAQQPAFHPLGTQRVLDVHDAVFVVERVSPDGTDRVIALHNAGHAALDLRIPATVGSRWQNLLNNTKFTAGDDGLLIRTAPFDVVWLTLLSV